eukprot:1913534-Pyramimonas_sp.AAC.1
MVDGVPGCGALTTELDAAPALGGGHTGATGRLPDGHRPRDDCRRGGHPSQAAAAGGGAARAK